MDKHPIKYFNKHKELHRIDGPAFEFSDGSKFWYKNGKRHRKNGPAIEYLNGREQYFLNGKLIFFSTNNKTNDYKQSP